MHWAELTSERLAQAAKDCDGLCLLPMGCIERHGPHLPLGTDQIVADAVSRRAADTEPAVVFPGYYFGKIWTARHYPGTFAAPPNLLLDLLECTVGEVARNGFWRILIVNSHGGNTSMLHFFLRSLLERPRDYCVYSTNLFDLDAETRRRWQGEFSEGGEGGHADEPETSVMLHLRGDLVKMDALGSPRDGRDRGGQKHLEGLDNPLSWYARFPTHYAGDARTATARKGAFLVDAMVAKLVRQMQAIKADGVTPELQREFHKRTRHSG